MSRNFLLLFLPFSLASCSLPVIPPQAGAARKVVLVHGFLETGKGMNYMCEEIGKSGYDCQVVKLRPSDGRGGLEKISQRMKRDIEKRFGTEEKISIVSFSMGGLVSRHYLQNLGGASRCDKLITISSPHNGTAAAFTYPSKGVRQMRPDSPFLKQLAATEGNLGDIHCTSYRTPFDLIILPPDSSVWKRAENLSYPVLLHPLMLTSRPVLTDILKRLAE
ncbi:MAG: lipase [Verrucomicrobiota bacterium]